MNKDNWRLVQTQIESEYYLYLQFLIYLRGLRRLRLAALILVLLDEGEIEAVAELEPSEILMY